MKLSALTSVAAVATAALLAATPTHACSDFRLNTTAADAGVLSGRTMDFAADLASVVEVLPRGSTFQEMPVLTCPTCPDYKWTSKFGFVALNMFGLNVAADGMNERGLSAAELYLTATQYPVPPPPSRTSSRNGTRDADKPIITSLCTYILGNFASVADVRAGLQRVQIAEYDERIAAVLLGQTGDLGRVPLHISVRDASGASLVIEFLHGNVTLYDNVNQVLTNDPPLGEQLAALAHHDAERDGLPGGYGSTERFVRLSLLNRQVPFGYPSAPPNATYLAGTAEQRAVADTLHLLNTVVRPPSQEATEWSIVRDHGRRKLYVRSNVNQVLRQVDLNALRFDDPASRRAVPVTHGAWFADMTSPLVDVANTQRTVDLPGRSELEALIRSHLPPSASPVVSPAAVTATPSPNPTTQDPPAVAAAQLTTTTTTSAPGSESSVSVFLLGCVCGAVVTSLLAVGGPIVLKRVRQRGYEPIPDANRSV